MSDRSRYNRDRLDDVQELSDRDKRTIKRKADINRIEKRASARRLLFIAVGAAAVILLVAFLWNISEISWEGELEYYSQRQILDVAGIDRGRSFLFWIPDTVEAKVEKALPFIKDIKIRKVLPNKVKITVVCGSDRIWSEWYPESAERVSVAIDEDTNDGRKDGYEIRVKYAEVPYYVLMDSNGKVLEIGGSVPAVNGVIHVKGVKIMDAEIGSTVELSIGEGHYVYDERRNACALDEEDPYDRDTERFSLMVGLAREIDEIGFSEVSEIDLTNTFSVKALAGAQENIIYFGASDDIYTKVMKIKEAYDQMLRRTDRLIYDLRFDDGLVHVYQEEKILTTEPGTTQAEGEPEGDYEDYGEGDHGDEDHDEEDYDEEDYDEDYGEDYGDDEGGNQDGEDIDPDAGDG